VEILRRGEVVVNRYQAGDAEDLKAILRGELSYEQVMEMSQNLMAEIEKVYEESNLPHRPDLVKINELCMELVEMQGW
jgi:hypothetical protein